MSLFSRRHENDGEYLIKLVTVASGEYVYGYINIYICERVLCVPDLTFSTELRRFNLSLHLLQLLHKQRQYQGTTTTAHPATAHAATARAATARAATAHPVSSGINTIDSSINTDNTDNTDNTNSRNASSSTDSTAYSGNTFDVDVAVVVASFSCDVPPMCRCR